MFDRTQYFPLFEIRGIKAVPSKPIPLTLTLNTNECVLYISRYMHAAHRRHFLVLIWLFSRLNGNATAERFKTTLGLDGVLFRNPPLCTVAKWRISFCLHSLVMRVHAFV